MILEYQNKYFASINNLCVKSLTDLSKFNILNYLMYRSLLPLFNTLYFKAFLASLIKRMVTKRLIEVKETNELLNCIVNCINSDDNYLLINIISNFNIDKLHFENFVLDFLNKWENLQKDYFSNKEIDLSEYSGLNIDVLISIERNVRYFYNLYLKFKSMIILSFSKSAFGNAVRYSQNFRDSISVDCLYDNYLSAIERAIEKYSPTKGTLAPYIKLWYKSSLIAPIYPFEDRVPFNVPHSKLVEANIDTIKIDIDSEEFEAIENKASSFLEEMDFSEVNHELLNFINSIDVFTLNLVKVVLDIPRIAKKF